MFIYSFHANTIKFFAVICLALTALIGLIAFVPTYIADDDTMWHYKCLINCVYCESNHNKVNDDCEPSITPIHIRLEIWF